VIIFWIFTLFVGASTFAFTDIFLQLGLAWSLADAFVAMLLCRGIFSIVRGRRVVAQLLGAAYIDDWRLMNVNKEAIDGGRSRPHRSRPNQRGPREATAGTL
jgi:hypothetical protein